MWSILIVDDHAVVRRGLAQILHEEFRPITFSEAAAPAEALLLAQNRIWDLIIVGVNLPGYDAFKLLREMRKTCPDVHILMFGVPSEHQYSLQSKKLGAWGYVCKDDPPAKLVDCIQQVLAGEKYFPDLFPIVSASTKPVLVGSGGREPVTARPNRVRDRNVSGHRT